MAPAPLPLSAPEHQLILALARSWKSLGAQQGAGLVAAHLAGLVRAAPPLPARHAFEALGCVMNAHPLPEVLELAQALVDTGRPWKGAKPWGWEATARAACGQWNAPDLVRALLSAPAAPAPPELSSRLVPLPSGASGAPDNQFTLLGWALHHHDPKPHHASPSTPGLECLEAVLAAGVDPSAPVDKQGHSALREALPGAFERLLLAGVDPLASTPGSMPGAAGLSWMGKDDLNTRSPRLQRGFHGLARSWPGLGQDTREKLSDLVVKRLGTWMGHPLHWARAANMFQAAQPLADQGLDMSRVRARAALGALRNPTVSQLAAIDTQASAIAAVVGPLPFPRQHHQMVPGVDDCAWPVALAAMGKQALSDQAKQAHAQDLVDLLPHLHVGATQWRVVAALQGALEPDAWHSLARQVAANTVAALVDPDHPDHALAAHPIDRADPGRKALLRAGSRRVMGVVQAPAHVVGEDYLELAAWLEFLLLLPSTQAGALEVIGAWTRAIDQGVVPASRSPFTPGVAAVLASAAAADAAARIDPAAGPARLRAFVLEHRLAPSGQGQAPARARM